MPAVGAVPPTPPIYHAAPPEVHSTLLNTGATAAGVTVAGTSWTQLAAQYVAGIAELEAILAQVQATYQGPSAEKFVAAHQPMLMWMADVVAKATLAAAAHGEIAAAYTTAVIMMPTMPELITNHVVHGVLVGTNFFGVNTIPIGMNEADYIRMWNQAADTQSTYDGVTAHGGRQHPRHPALADHPDSRSRRSRQHRRHRRGLHHPGASPGQRRSAQRWGHDEQQAARRQGRDKPAVGGQQDARWPHAAESQNTANEAGQQLKPENMGSVLQQFTSIASSAPQAASSAIQGPANMLMQAPQQLASAPQQLSSMLSQFAGGFGSDLAQQGASLPAGFAGTGAIQGFNPAGMTSLAGGALGTGPSRPLMPSTWGSAPASAAESMTNAARGISPVAAGLPGAERRRRRRGGAGMMGHGANSRRSSRSQQVNTYSDDAEDADADADSDGGTFTMTR